MSITESPAQKKYESARIKINRNDRKTIESIARNCGSTDNKHQPSIQHFLEDIASGRLEVFKRIHLEDKGQNLGRDNHELFELTINVICDLNGTIAVITRIIKDADGGIHQTVAEETNNIITVIFDCPNGEKDIVRQINDIRLSDVIDYNGLDKKEDFLAHVSQQSYEVYQGMIDQDAKKSCIENVIESQLDKRIIKSLKQSFYLLIEIRMVVGAYHDVVENIAKKKITIISTNQQMDYQEQITRVSIFAGVNPFEKDSKFKGTTALVYELSQLPNVIKIEHRKNGLFYRSNNPNLQHLEKGKAPHYQ